MSFELANSLLIKTEKRGEHATGFWACERGNGRVFFDKEPVKSSVYATRDIWCKQFANADTDLLIAHCRFTSLNVGHEKYNKNNHPHVSEDRRVALVHNGKIPEYSALKSRYDLRSDCDSEILLGMFESGIEFKNKEDYLKQEFPTMTPEIAYRMMGLREVFSRVNYGAMAVAIGERGEDTRQRFLWMFRDDERPLHVVDMRKTLGQIFFCSEAEIWRSAVEACPSVKPYIPSDQVIIEFPTYQVWLLSIDPNSDEKAETLAWDSLKVQKDKEEKALYENKEAVPEDVWKTAVTANADSWRVKKFRITKTKFYDWKPDDDEDVKLKRVKASKPVTKVVSRLAADEEVVKVEKAEAKTEAKEEVRNGSTGLPIREAKALIAAPPGKKKAGSNTVSNTVTDAISGTIDYGVDDDVIARHTNKDEALTELSETTIPDTEIDMEAFSTLMTELKQLLSDVETNVSNLQREGTLSKKDFSVIMDSLKDAHAELKGSIIFLK